MDEAGRGALAFGVVAAAVVLSPFASADEWLRHAAGDDPAELRRLGALLASVRDSKKMSKNARRAADVFVREEFALAYGVGRVTAAEVDELNVLRATHLAMHRALDALRADLGAKNKKPDPSPRHDDHEPALEPSPPEPLLPAPEPDRPDRPDGNDADDDEEEPLWPELPEDGRYTLGRVMVDGDRFSPPYRDLPHVCVPRADGKHLHVACASVLAKVARDSDVEAACAAEPELDRRYDFKRNMAYGTPRHMAGLAAHGPSPFHRRTFAPVATALASRLPPL